MSAADISYTGLVLCFMLLAVPFFISLKLRVFPAKDMLVPVMRMSVQLALIGFFLKYLFEWNNALVNCLWLGLMVMAATFSAVKTSKLNARTFLLPTFSAFFIVTFSLITYINALIVHVDSFWDVRYVIVLGGMLLGNALKGNIIGISSFYDALAKDEKHYRYTLSLGASLSEALRPYIRDSLRAAANPTLASMATMGIVHLPGMMSGQMLGGSSPLTAIKYQLMIMVTIFVCIYLSVLLTLFLTIKSSFSPAGIMRRDIHG